MKQLQHYSYSLRIIFLVLLIKQSYQQNQLNIQCYGENQSPIYIKSDYKCENNVDYPLILDFKSNDITLTQVEADYHRKYVTNEDCILLNAKDTNNINKQFKLSSIEIFTPARHRIKFKQPNQKYISYNSEIELVFFMDLVQNNYSQEENESEKEQEQEQEQQNNNNINGKYKYIKIEYAAISFLFNRRQTKGPLDRNINGDFLLESFIKDNIKINYNAAQSNQKYYEIKKNHGFYQYHGSKIAENCDEENVNWFLFDEILNVNDDIYDYFDLKYGKTNIQQGASREIQQFNNNKIIKVGCYLDHFQELQKNSNYGFWGYLFIISLYFLLSLKNVDHRNIYQKEYWNNIKTLIPIYSIMKLEHKLYFNRNRRSTVYLVQIILEIFIQSVLIEISNSEQNEFIGYSAIAVVIACPIGFILGYLNSLTYQKQKVILDSETKIIKASEHNKDNEEFIQQIEKAQFEQHKISYFFYCICFFIVVGCWIASSFMMSDWTGKQFIAWFISIPVMLGFDAIGDFIIVKFKIKVLFFAKKGYYLSHDLADLILQNKNIKIV